MSNTYPPVPPTPPTSQLPPRRHVRRGLVVGAVVVGLAGVGGAAAWAANATNSPSPAPSASASAQPGHHAGKPGAGQVGAETLHGQMTVKKADGTIETVFVQRGTVTDVSDTKVTIKSDDGFTQTYTLNSSTRFLSQAEPKGAAIKSGDLAKGDTVMVRAVQSGSDYVVQQLTKGPFPGKEIRQGFGQRHERGQGTQSPGTQSPKPSAPSTSKPSPSPSSTS
ncbi:hypothetical protein [Sinomonas sp. P47F7]|uniref:hypothetical protein n=1 Tax=Sinomonas sp. P47F7 TaxID=3410987 RepID=UPI003BF58916